MEKYEIMALLNAKIDEVFAEVQKREGIKDGDIDYGDALALDKLTEQGAELIHKVIQYQKEWSKC